MKIVKYILILFAFIVSSTYGMTYIATDPGDLGLAQAAIGGVTLAANQIAVPTNDGSAYEAKDCSDKAAIKSALEADHSADGADGSLKHGPCCINAHHVVCQEIQRQIRANCPHTGKGDASLSADAAVCPQ